MIPTIMSNKSSIFFANLQNEAVYIYNLVSQLDGLAMCSEDFQREIEDWEIELSQIK